MKFELKGYNIDNLLKTLYSKRVVLFDIKRPSHDEVIFTCHDSDEKKVKRYIKNFQVKKTLSKFKALPKLLLANVGVILGLFFGIIFSIFASNYTWQIKVYGTKDLTENEIVEVLKNNGVKTGKINLLKSEEIETILLNNYDRIAQVSVIKRGTAIIINLSEKLVYNEQDFQPIRAKYSGIVTDINIVTGTCNVKVGDYVNVGDELVLPFNIKPNGEKVSVKPMAEIKAQIFVTGRAELNKQETVLIRTGKQKTTYKYKLGKLNLFSGKNKNSFALFECVSYNENVTDLVPLNRDVIIYHELAPTVIEHNFETEREDLTKKSVDLVENALPNYLERISTNTKVSIAGNTMIAITTVSLIGFIND